MTEQLHNFGITDRGELISQARTPHSPHQMHLSSMCTAVRTAVCARMFYDSPHPTHVDLVGNMMPDVSIEAAMRDDFKDFYNCWTVKALSGIKCVSPNSLCDMTAACSHAFMHHTARSLTSTCTRCACMERALVSPPARSLTRARALPSSTVCAPTRRPPTTSPCDALNRTANRTACEESMECRWTEVTSTCTAIPNDDVSDVCEVAVFGFPPFCNGSSTPCTVEESGSRPVYVAFNLRKVDVGNPMFGAVSAVFSDYLRPTSFVAPLDTGYWEFSGCNASLVRTTNPTNCTPLTSVKSCNAVWDCDWRRGTDGVESCVNILAEKSQCWKQPNETACSSDLHGGCVWKDGQCTFAMGPQSNKFPASSCAGWPIDVAPTSLGLLDPPAYHHSLLQSVNSWIDLPGGAAGQLAELLCRMKVPDAVPLTSLQVFKYWEANGSFDTHYFCCASTALTRHTLLHCTHTHTLLHHMHGINDAHDSHPSLVLFNLNSISLVLYK